MSEGPPEMTVEPRRPFLGGLSIVWLVPVLALVISLAIAWQSFASRGVLIQIAFPDASGVTAGDTTLRYREVVVGVVEDVAFAEGLSQVIVSVRVDQDIAEYMDEEAQFWVVRPEVTTRGITGLSTVLSGVYIAGAWDGTPGIAQRRFEGRADAPLVLPDQPGTRITLTADDGNMISAGGPVFFRGIEVGQVEAPQLSEDGQSVTVAAFIRAPHDARLTSATRFWDMSGFSVSLGPSGISLDVASLGALVSGGVAFDTFVPGAPPLGPDPSFVLFPDQSSARSSVFAGVEGELLDLSLVLDGSVAGLAPGAEVTFQGLRVGEVTSIGAFVDDSGPVAVPRVRVLLGVSPLRLGLGEGATPEEALDFLQAEVAGGLRARLDTANLFSSALRIDLVQLGDDAAPAELDLAAEPAPRLPVVDSELPDFTATAEGALERINALPIEELLGQAISLMASIEALARSEDTRALPGAAVALLDEGRALVGSEATQALPAEIRAAAEDLRAVLADLRAQDVAGSLTAALDGVAEAAAAIPPVAEEFGTLADRAAALPLEDLVTAATDLVASADAVIGTEGARDVPPALAAALDEVRAVLADLRAGGATENLNATLQSTRDAASTIAEATASLPELSARLSSLVTQAEGLVATYGTRSAFSDETLSTLRDVRDAARAVTSLARTIERNPNSLLLGR